ncbi:DUF397 domain-containing protein [Streptomyces phaeochromogenes]|nr:DUF397 domain-containing protein [Streptomyces phaeochromogenes]
MSIGPQVAPDHTWFKSSYSGGNTTECLEATYVPTGVLIRDSKQPEGPHVAISAEAWGSFLAARLD